jgi:hypothetical protein
MKIKLAGKGRCITSALEVLTNSKNESVSPVMILWNDSPASQAKLLEYVSNKGYHLIRFGIACNGAFILDEIYYQLTSQHCNLSNQDLKVEAISKLIQNKKHLSVFVVTHFHLIKGDQISWLTGLIFEFDLNAKFIFVGDKDRLIQGTSKYDRRFEYFLKQMKLEYEINN